MLGCLAADHILPSYNSSTLNVILSVDRACLLMLRLPPLTDSSAPFSGSVCSRTISTTTGGRHTKDPESWGSKIILYLSAREQQVILDVCETMDSVQCTAACFCPVPFPFLRETYVMKSIIT